MVPIEGWNQTVYVVVSSKGLHWVGFDATAAEIMAQGVRESHVVKAETGTAYMEGR